MVSHPWLWVKPLADAGASQLTFHLETTYDESHLRELIHSIKATNMKVGVAVKPSTPLNDDLRQVLTEGLVDMVLVMTVEPGFGGQGFLAETVDKVRELRSAYPDLDLQVDGGITAETAQVACEAGANILVSGSWLFKHADPASGITTLRRSVA